MFAEFAHQLLTSLVQTSQALTEDMATSLHIFETIFKTTNRMNITRIETQSHQKDISIILIHTPKEIEKLFTTILVGIHLSTFFSPNRNSENLHIAPAKHLIEP